MTQCATTSEKLPDPDCMKYNDMTYVRNADLQQYKKHTDEKINEIKRFIYKVTGAFVLFLVGCVLWVNDENKEMKAAITANSVANAEMKLFVTNKMSELKKELDKKTDAQLHILLEGFKIIQERKPK